MMYFVEFYADWMLACTFVIMLLSRLNNYGTDIPTDIPQTN